MFIHNGFILKVKFENGSKDEKKMMPRKKKKKLFH